MKSKLITMSPFTKCWNISPKKLMKVSPKNNLSQSISCLQDDGLKGFDSDGKPVKIQNVRITHNRALGETYKGNLNKFENSSSVVEASITQESSYLEASNERNNFKTDFEELEMNDLSPAQKGARRFASEQARLRRREKPSNGSVPVPKVERAYVPPTRGLFTSLSTAEILLIVSLFMSTFIGAFWMNKNSTYKNKTLDSHQSLTLSMRSWYSSEEREKLFGYSDMPEAPLEDLVPILEDGSVLLRVSAAYAFLNMQKAALEDGVRLVPIAGFRSVSEQQEVYYGKKIEGGKKYAGRARVSGPPGFSEHHTGYAIDIGDEDSPDMSLHSGFDQTKAFLWLAKNGARFHFEMPFHKDNNLGYGYEPWHWRFVGDSDSLHTFRWGM